jgi:hypothetical protein
MQKILILTLATALGSSLSAQVSLVQTAQCHGTSGNCSASFGSLPTVGHMIAVATTALDGGTIGGVSCSDNQSNSYVSQAHMGTTSVEGGDWFTAYVNNSSGTFTVSCTAGVHAINAFLFELQGQSTTTSPVICVDNSSEPNGTNTAACPVTVNSGVSFLLFMSYYKDATSNPNFTAANGDTLGPVDLTLGANVGAAGTAYQSTGNIVGGYPNGLTFTGSGGLGSYQAQRATITICSVLPCVPFGGYVAQPKSHWP